MMLVRTLWAASLLVTAAITPALSAESVSPAVQAAVADAGRDPLDMRRDGALKPADVVAFTGLKPGGAVADVIPGYGYYTRIFSKLVGPKGNVYPIVPFNGAINAETLRRLSGDEKQPVDDIYAVQNVYGYENVRTIWQDLKLDGAQFSVPKQLDLVFVSGDYAILHGDLFG